MVLNNIEIIVQQKCPLKYNPSWFLIVFINYLFWFNQFSYANNKYVYYFNMHVFRKVFKLLFAKYNIIPLYLNVLGIHPLSFS